MGALYLADLREKRDAAIAAGCSMARWAAGSASATATTALTASTSSTSRRRRSSAASSASTPPAAARARSSSSWTASACPAPAGGNWGPTVIHGHAKRGTGLLNNRFYVGTEVWGQCTDGCGGSQPLIPTALYVVARMTAIRPRHQ